MPESFPPLNALRAFEAAGRHLSFTKAAAELHVTPAAISHQIKTLESLLGLKLFTRSTRAIHLTEAGRSALPALGAGFGKLAEGVQELRTHRDSRLLTVSVSPSFGAMWLVPRLDRFRRKHPDIEIRIDGTDRRVDLLRDQADVAIRYGPGDYEGARVDYLFGQHNTPVCSPVLLEGRHRLQHPRDLRHHTLLHVEWKDAEASWRMWLLAAGLHEVDPNRGPRFSMESMAIQAALDGQGVALVGDKLVADELASGRLVQPFEEALSRLLTFGYYLLCPHVAVSPGRVSAFRDWLVEEARQCDL
ncbi:MAG: transcriptional regulator GcvA [Pseudomonadota bacterium]